MTKRVTFQVLSHEISVTYSMLIVIWHLHESFRQKHSESVSGVKISIAVGHRLWNTDSM